MRYSPTKQDCKHKIVDSKDMEMKKVIEYSRYLPRLRGDHAKLLPLLQHVAFHHKKLNTKRKKILTREK